MSKRHLVVVIFFRNTALKELIESNPESIKDIYDQAIAEKYEFEKQLIIHELKKYGVHGVLSTPRELTVNTINKYLEIKARGIL